MASSRREWKATDWAKMMVVVVVGGCNERKGKIWWWKQGRKGIEAKRLKTFISEEHSRKNILMDLKGEAKGGD